MPRCNCRMHTAAREGRLEEERWLAAIEVLLDRGEIDQEMAEYLRTVEPR